MITAVEAPNTASPPERQITDAFPIMVGNLGPHDGYVEFVFGWWYVQRPYRYLGTDVTVFDPSDPSGMNLIRRRGGRRAIARRLYRRRQDLPAAG